MHEVIKKSIDVIEKWRMFEDMDLIDYDEYNVEDIKEHFIHSYITLAEEKIKELEGEKVEVPTLCRNVPSQIAHEKALSHNQAKQEEIDKWKQFISELKQ